MPFLVHRQPPLRLLHRHDPGYRSNASIPNRT